MKGALRAVLGTPPDAVRCMLPPEEEPYEEGVEAPVGEMGGELDCCSAMMLW
jgi:hypothetical protein